MKILAFSDLHRDQTAAKEIVNASVEADLIVGAGDFATQGKGAIEVLDILKTCQVPIILVHGNHDAPDELAEYCNNQPNFHYLHGKSLTIGELVFFGVGGEIPSRNSFRWNAAETEVEATKLLSDCPKNAILITHTPPFGVADVQTSGEHEGSAAIHAAALKLRPKLLLCGHIHNAWSTHGSIGETQVHNLGPTVNWFDV